MADRYISEGGFPEAAGLDAPLRKSVHTNLFNDVVVRDVAARFGVPGNVVRDLAYFALTNVGKEFSFRGISRSLGVHVDTASKYLEYLRESELIHTIEFHSYKLKERFRRNSKLYCVDQGLVQSVSEGGREPGRLMENAVFVEFLRRGENVHYWKGESGREVDFVEGQKSPKAFQVCWDISRKEVREREVTALVECLNSLKLVKGTVITLNVTDEETVDGKRIEYLPLWRFLLGI
jgi:predicted AAA+ superfamily ATPase